MEELKPVPLLAPVAVVEALRHSVGDGDTDRSEDTLKNGVGEALNDKDVEVVVDMDGVAVLDKETEREGGTEPLAQDDVQLEAVKEGVVDAELEQL